MSWILRKSRMINFSVTVLCCKFSVLFAGIVWGVYINYNTECIVSTTSVYITNNHITADACLSKYICLHRCVCVCVAILYTQGQILLAGFSQTLNYQNLTNSIKQFGDQRTSMSSTLLECYKHLELQCFELMKFRGLKHLTAFSSHTICLYRKRHKIQNTMAGHLKKIPFKTQE